MVFGNLGRRGIAGFLSGAVLFRTFGQLGVSRLQFDFVFFFFFHLVSFGCLDVADEVCKEAKCGRGACKPSGNSTLLYECECDPGWKQTLSSTDSHLKFLPCVIPNCTLNYSCMKSPASAEEKTKQANESILNPCHWVDCGGGSCNMTSIISYSCLCDEGYHNLFNLTPFPCYTQCAIGMDCLNLGISSSNNTALAPTLADSDGSRGSLMRGSSHWLVALMFFLGILQCP
ncbi:uncharacterized protein LOC115693247 [Syzygium oleosum]|uniref:uncharacterized protein LOC115693247 n=1 Tax=Syzygium oleosum TaxID=219896 RepID=UPI0024B930E6|nr:uncharacterized protein LOC115693247 [Syzygium oleosum]